MTFFPHTPLKRPLPTKPGLLAGVPQKLARDILWNQPVFKAPGLSNPRIALDPLPFTATRLTQGRRKA